MSRARRDRARTACSDGGRAGGGWRRWRPRPPWGCWQCGWGAARRRGPQNSARAEAVPTVSERASVPSQPFAQPQPPSGVVAGPGAGSPRASRKEADTGPAERAAAAAAPAVGALADARPSPAAEPPAAPSALAAGEARLERAQPERQREVEARRDAATDQFRTAPVPSAAPTAVPPPVEETLAAAAPGSLAKATASESMRRLEASARRISRAG